MLTNLMLNVCRNCGEYRVDKLVDRDKAVAICPLCQHPHPFRLLPFLAVCGASGTGKTTVCDQLMITMQEAVVLDGDLLWRPEFNKPENQYRDFFETWLRLGKNIGQSGRPFVLFGAGVIPNNVEPCVERRYFSESYYLALVCEAEALTTRLKQRPAWLQSGDKAFIEEQIRFNGWLREQAEKPNSKIELLDTTHESIETTGGQVAAWIRAKI